MDVSPKLVMLVKSVEVLLLKNKKSALLFPAQYFLVGNMKHLFVKTLQLTPKRHVAKAMKVPESGYGEALIGEAVWEWEPK